MQVCLPSCGRKLCKTCDSGMVEDEEHFCVGCPVKRPFAQIDGLKKLNQDLGCCMNVSAQYSMRTQTVEWESFIDMFLDRTA